MSRVAVQAAPTVEHESAGIIVALKAQPGEKPGESLKRLQLSTPQRVSVQSVQLTAAVESAEQPDDQGLMVVAVPEGQSAVEFAAAFTAAYSETGLLDFVQPNWIIPAPETVPVTDTVVPQASDPLATNQWAIKQAHLKEAWSIQPQITIPVGFVDSGYDLGHEDLPPLAGWHDFTDEASNKPLDTMGHGTHVAGISCAIRENGKGISGIGNGCPQIYMARVFNGPGTGAQLIWVIRAMDWLRESGVRIANLSLGAKGWPGQAYADAFKRFQNAGGIVVAAAGNNGQDEDFYPARLNGVISVARIEESGSLAATSNYGEWVTLAAPGGHILSTYMRSYAAYVYLNGTSMATPHVTGVVGLMKSLNRCLTHDQIVSILRDSAQPLNEKGVAGTLDAGRALEMAKNMHCLYLPMTLQL